MAAPPDPGSAEALRRRVADLAAVAPGPRRPLHTDGQWWYLQDPRMPSRAHGWKLHLSARQGQLPQLLDVVVPILLRHTCDAKFAAGAAVLRELNSGLRGPAAVGKAVTVYPQEAEVVRLGLELAEALAGWAGPQVVSDRRIRSDAPVFYRYGLFRMADGDGGGDADYGMAGPDGSVFPGLAEARYRQPPWARDPFTPVSTAVRPSTTRVGVGRYRITAGITRSPNGHVYRAVEVVTGREVVVKQARAYVAEDGAGTDARGRLRHERRVLAALAGVPGVPPLVDYFRHGPDEYLVSGACGPRDLRRDVLAAGPYDSRAGAGGRDWWALARGLLRVLDAVHARGVVVCDLKPANVVLDTGGGCSLVDFGVSALDGDRPPGATAGYGLPGATGTDPAEDYYALGTTLHHALTGLDPVVIDPDPATNRDRTLACLRAALPAPIPSETVPPETAHPETAHPALALVTGLLSLDPARRLAAASSLRGGGAAVRPPARPPAGPRRAPLDEVLDHTVGTCVRMAHDLVAGGPGRAGEPRTLLSLYDGAAGLGLELLQHADRPDARAAATALAGWTAAHPALDRLDGSLYQGRTGVELFLAQAAAALGTPAPHHRHHEPVGADQIAGAAGLGTGHLLLAALGRDADRHLSAAAACAAGLTSRPLEEPGEVPNPGTAALAEGFAHGRAGIAHFLLAMPDEASGRAARRFVDGLAADLPRIIAAALRPGATRRYLSWCRGLAGLGTVLVQAGHRYGDDALLALAADAADACRTLAPRTALVVRCCGLAGVGDLLVDLATATGDPRHWQAAEDLAALLLTRSGGPPGRPVFPGGDPTAESRAWAVGTPGVLTFLRRLSRHGGPVPGLLPLG
ncbi:tRNA A-37 threonylcarbamoyl transferase component Bud32 [Kitasatospora sp. MAA19]|uniref:class IV lanthionine synthetase LanL n=1 Tax=Kitasatospora sp. MAA19 TaxID=3035090 RepID=UPI002476B943|nr:class IV lanthionine synthetase LanL [Kitasatospora sp. MAA19]MDH6708250.1 tRNA A-37 threonylcarbamoyl transferase component Bud32 [Kitasatospora sp. MAA19]